MSNWIDKNKAVVIQELEKAIKKLAEIECREQKRVEIETAIKESEQRFRNIVQASPMGIHMYRLESGERLVFQGANPAANIILGIDNSQFIGKTIEEAFPPLKDTEIPEKYRRAATLGESWRTEQVNYQDQQITGAFEVYAFQTGPNAMAAMFLDITERKRVENALRFTQFSVDRMSDAAFWMGTDARFIYVNEAACSSLNYSKEELLTMNVQDMDPNFPSEKWPEHWKEVKEKGSFTIESRHRTREGRIFPVEITVNYLEFEGQEYNCAFARDISARKLAEKALKASEEKYRQLIQYSNDAIYLLYNKKFEVINEKFKDMLNITEEYVNSPEFDFMEMVAPKSRSLIEERNQKLARGEKLAPKYRFTALSKDGREIEVETSVTYLSYKDGIATQGILRDITERKEIEEKMRQAQKLEAIGTLAGGIAHDFNNLLMGVQGRTSLMLLQPDLPSIIVDHLKGIEEYIKSATNLTRQLLSFASGGRYEVRPLNINDLIKRSATMFGRTKKEINIHENYQEDVWIVEVDAGQIEQVFLNLFVNAWQAMPGGGNLSLQTENVILNKEDIDQLDRKPGKYVKVSITDTGIGMDNATRQRIFDPFFTTKQMGRGTGMGLATVYGILKNHDGFITVTSKVEVGSSFEIYLPASEKKQKVERSALGTIKKGSGTILLVDDEEVFLEVTGPILQNLGYKVLMARNGQEALKAYTKNKKRIYLVILDMIMPDFNGREVYDKLKEVNPEVKVLLSSGYSMSDETKTILDRGCDGFIQKPFDVEQLSKKVFEILENNE